jgi:hypothetical protein
MTPCEDVLDNLPKCESEVANLRLLLRSDRVEAPPISPT